MSSINYWFQFDSASGVIYPYSQENSPSLGVGISVIGPYPHDTASADIVMAYNYPERYTVQNGSLIQKPYFTLNVSVIQGGYVFTATLNNPPSGVIPASCKFNVIGQSYSEQIVNNDASFTIKVHESIADEQFSITVAAQGVNSATVQVGKKVCSQTFQCCTPLKGDTTPLIAPSGVGSYEFLADYWQSSITSNVFQISDLATITGINTYVLYHIIIPTLISSNPNLLSANAMNALQDIQNNILNNLPTTLENAAPYPVSGTQSYDIHYQSYRGHSPLLKQAMMSYVNDVQTIPNLG